MSLPSNKAVNILPTAKDYIKQRKPRKVKKVVIKQDGKVFYVRDIKKGFHTKSGEIDLKKEVQVLRNEEFHVFNPHFFDVYRNIMRVAQIPPLKDVGALITNTGINKNSKIVESGSGSGGLTCFLASIAKKVTSYELREDYFDVVKKNLDYMDIKNVTLKNKNFEDASEKDQDVVILDMPSPHKYFGTAKKLLKRGGFLALYLPCITQVEEALNNNSDFLHIKTLELIEREWHVEGKKIRPKSQGLMHSAFLVFCRKK